MWKDSENMCAMETGAAINTYLATERDGKGLLQKEFQAEVGEGGDQTLRGSLGL